MIRIRKISSLAHCLVRGMCATAIVVAGLVQTSAAESDISGYWKSESGAVYRFSKEAQYIVAIYYRPNADQLAHGIKSGDLAWKGTAVSDVLLGTWYSQFEMPARDVCPGMFRATYPLVLTHTKDGKLVGSEFIQEHISEECIIDGRMLSTIVMERTTSQETPSVPVKMKASVTSSGG